MAGTFTWITTTGTADWDTATNWNPGTVPGAGARIFINEAGTYTVTINGASDATVAIGGAASTLTVNDANATLSIIGGAAGLGIQGAGTLDLNAGTIKLSGTGATLEWNTGTVASLIDQVSGTGTIGQDTAAGTWTIVAGGTIEVAGGTLDVGTPANGDLMTINTGNFLVGSGADLVLDKFAALGSTTNAGTITFAAGTAAGTLAVNVTTVADYFASNVFNATLKGFAMSNGTTVGSVIDLLNAGSISASGTYVGNGTTIQIIDNSKTYDFDTNTTLTGHGVNIKSDGAGGLDVWVCYAEGTRLLTEDGEVPVEAITEGTRVITLVDGEQVPQPVVWVGRRRIDLGAHPQPNLGAPVRIRAGAFGENLPHRDLVVSPDHALFVDGKLIPAKLLINDMTIVQERDTRFVTYYHIELDRHAILLAEGLPAESYLDTGNRAFFANAGLALMLHPNFEVNAGLKCWETDACAPLAVSAELVQPVWRSLAERAETLGYGRSRKGTTDEPDLRLMADGRAIRPVSRNDGRYVFALPAGVTSLRLASRASVPSHMLAYLDDWRHLGVAVRQISFRGNDGMIELPPDHPGLTQGWYQVERDDATMWRWMNGNAVVPAPEMDGPVMVEVHVGIAMTHVVENEAVQRLAA